MAAAATARSSAWYCTGATAKKDGAANGTLVIANAGARGLTGTVTVYPSEGERRSAPVQVGVWSRATMELSHLAPAPFASALVELDGGEAVVELAADGPLGQSVTSCASAASPQWYFADGVTTKDAAETLALFNPFPDDAVVDVAFGTEDGPVTPQALTGLAVRAEGMTVVNTGDFVQRRQQVTAAVRARAGRLVAARLQTFDGTAGRKGMSVTLGAAAPGTLWYLPDGLVADGLSERYQIYNPGDQEAQVHVELTLERGEAEPMHLTVPAESRVTITADDEPRIPKTVPHAVTVRSDKGIGVVVERSIDAVAPSRRTGHAATLGARLAARGWCLAAGESDDSTDEFLVFENPGRSPARVSVTVLADGTPLPAGGIQDLEVAAGQRRAVRLGDSVKRDATPLVVHSDQPVIVERVLNRLKGIGISQSVGIPLRG
jgi:hypothetical protein